MKYYPALLFCTICIAVSLVLCAAVVVMHRTTPMVFSDDDGHLTYKPIVRYEFDEVRIRTFLDYVLTRYMSTTVGYQNIDILKPMVNRKLIIIQKNKMMRFRHTENSFKERQYYMVKDVKAFDAPKMPSYIMPFIVRTEMVDLTDSNMSAVATQGYSTVFTHAEITDGYIICFLEDSGTDLENPWGLFLYQIRIPNNQEGDNTWDVALPIHEFTFRGFGKFPKSQRDEVLGPKQN